MYVWTPEIKVINTCIYYFNDPKSVMGEKLIRYISIIILGKCKK